LRPHGKLVLNTATPEKYSLGAGRNEIIAVDATSLALQVLGRAIANTALLGALVAASGIVQLESAIRAIEHDMKPGLAGKNIEILQRTYACAGGGGA
jgi:pyruvate ferredoxin oxidoreductase gamma subunit